MTNPSMVLATAGRQRRVEYRQRLLFLIWDERCIYLEPEELACLSRLLATGVMELELFRLGEGNFRLEQRRLGHFKLQLGACCLELPLLDFLTLVQLVRQANRRLPVEERQPLSRADINHQYSYTKEIYYVPTPNALG